MQRHYKLRPSRFLTLLIVFLGLAPLVVLWLLPIPGWALVLPTLALLFWGGYRLLFDARLRLGNSCVAFRLEDQEGIVLVLRSGSHRSGLVLNDSLVTPYLVILNVVLNEQRGKRSLLILPDTMSAESNRRLRVVLRWGDKAEPAASV